MLGPTAHDTPQHTLRSSAHIHPDVPIRPILSNLIHSCTHWRVSPIPARGLEVMRASSLVVLLALLIVGVGVALLDFGVYHRVEKMAPSTSRLVPDHAAAPSPCRPVSSDDGPENGRGADERDEDTSPPRPLPSGGHPRREDPDSDPRTRRTSLAGGLVGSRAEGNFRCPAGVDRTVSKARKKHARAGARSVQ